MSDTNIAESVAIAKATVVCGEKLALSYAKDESSTFTRAKLIHAGARRGIKLDALATATARARVRIDHPELDAETVEVLAESAAYVVNKGTMSRAVQSINAQEKAGVHVSQAATVLLLKVLNNTRGASGLLDTLAADALAVDAGDARDALYLAGVRAILAAPKAATESADEPEGVETADSEGEGTPVVPASGEVLAAGVVAALNAAAAAVDSLDGSDLAAIRAAIESFESAYAAA